MAEVTEEPKQTKGVKRSDPAPRPVEGIANRGYLEHHDPTKHYVWVSEVNDPTINVGYYKSLGYKVAQYDPDEARPTIGYQEYKQGDPIKSLGMVLMEVPIERKREIDSKGWQMADSIQETIRKRDLDPLDKREFKGITTRRTEQDDRHRWEF